MGDSRGDTRLFILWSNCVSDKGERRSARKLYEVKLVRERCDIT